MPYRTVFPNELVEAAVAGDFQKYCDELHCATEGAIPLAYIPSLPIPLGPSICSYVEGVRLMKAPNVEHIWP